MELEETEEYQRYKAKLQEKEKTILHGDDVVHLTYLSPLVENDIIESCSNKLDKVGVRLSTYDDFGTIKASLEDYALQICLIVANPISIKILKTVGLNTIWEVVKASVIKVHDTIFNKDKKSPINPHKDINFGVKIRLDKKIAFDFKLDGDLSDELILKSLDKSLDFIKSQTEIPVHQLPMFVEFDKEKDEWKAIDVIAEIKKKQSKDN